MLALYRVLITSIIPSRLMGLVAMNLHALYNTSH